MVVGFLYQKGSRVRFPVEFRPISEFDDYFSNIISIVLPKCLNPLPTQRATPINHLINMEISMKMLRPAFVFLVKQKGMKRKEVATLFGVKPHTIGEAIKRYEQNGDF